MAHLASARGESVRTLDRYLIKEMIVPLLLGTLVVVVMFQANWLIALYREFKLDRVPAQAVAQYILLKTPGFLQMTLPVGIALASSLALSRLARESELTAIRGAGVPIRRILVPVLALGLLVSAANFAVGEYVMPRTEKRARQLQTEIGMLGSMQPLKQNVMISLDRYAAFFAGVSAQGDRIELNDITLIENRGNGETLVIRAPRGTYENGDWAIQQPTTLLFRGATVISFETATKPLRIFERISVPQFFLTQQAEEKTIEELRQSIDQGKRQRMDTTFAEVTLHSKYAVPASCLVFALTGPVMAIAFVRRGPFVGVLLSLVVTLLYYNLYIIGTQIIGRNGWLPPLASAWLPNLLLLIGGLLWLRRLE